VITVRLIGGDTHRLDTEDNVIKLETLEKDWFVFKGFVKGREQMAIFNAKQVQSITLAEGR